MCVGTAAMISFTDFTTKQSDFHSKQQTDIQREEYNYDIIIIAPLLLNVSRGSVVPAQL